MNISFLILRKFLLTLVFCIYGSSLVFASPHLAQALQPETGEKLLVAQNESDRGHGDCFREGADRPHRGPDGECLEHRGPGMHQGERGRKGGMGKGMHRGRRGPGRGMGHGMRHGGGERQVAQCPQPRSTAKAPEEIYNRSNPLGKTTDTIESGRLLFQLDAQPTCTLCHGRKGDGTGMMAQGLNPPPRNFTCAETMHEMPDGQLFWIIKNGSPGTGMPAFPELQDRQIWQLILTIRQFASKGK